MKAQYDKIEPYANSTRGRLNAAFNDPAKLGTPYGVGFNANGRMVVGAGQTGIIGVLLLSTKKKAGDAVDAMTSGDITGFEGTAGTKYYADPTTGVISATNAAGKTYVGFTAEADRLVVRVGTNLVTPAA